jgi:hypothetical protein
MMHHRSRKLPCDAGAILRLDCSGLSARRLIIIAIVEAVAPSATDIAVVADRKMGKLSAKNLRAA